MDQKRVKELRFSCEQLMDIIQDYWKDLPDSDKPEIDRRLKNVEEIVHRKKLETEV